jgi:hypothetical protein
LVRTVQRGVAEAAAQVHVRARVHQQHRGRSVTAADREPQRRVVVEVLGIHIGAAHAEEHVDARGVACHC